MCIKPCEHGDCMFRNEWLNLKDDEFNFKPRPGLAWDVGYLGVVALG